MPDLKAGLQDPSLWGLLAVNALTILIALLDGWGIMALMWTYWLQSVIIGMFNVVKILSLKEFSTEGFKVNDKTTEPTSGTKITTAAFFAVHYGFFHLVYMLFLAFSFSGMNVITLSFLTNGFWVLLGGAAFFANHLYSYLHGLPSLRASKPNIGMMMFFPYARIIPMHLTILFGGFFLMADANSGIVLVLFMVLKTGADAFMHMVEHGSSLQSA